MTKFNPQKLTKLLRADAKALNIPPGAADSFIERTISATKKQLKSKRIITEEDLSRIVAKELSKYNKNLAYVYKNRDKII